MVLEKGMKAKERRIKEEQTLQHPAKGSLWKCREAC